MTVHELVNKYDFHDSMITCIRYSSENKELVIILDFCYWAQEWYKENDPELMKLKLTFYGISEYSGIVGDIDNYSVLDSDIRDNTYHIFIEDDFNQQFYEYFLNPSDIKIDILEMFNEV